MSHFQTAISECFDQRGARFDGSVIPPRVDCRRSKGSLAWPNLEQVAGRADMLLEQCKATVLDAASPRPSIGRQASLAEPPIESARHERGLDEVVRVADYRGLAQGPFVPVSARAAVVAVGATVTAQAEQPRSFTLSLSCEGSTGRVNMTGDARPYPLVRGD